MFRRRLLIMFKKLSKEKVTLTFPEGCDRHSSKFDRNLRLTWALHFSYSEQRRTENTYIEYLQRSWNTAADALQFARGMINVGLFPIGIVCSTRHNFCMHFNTQRQSLSSGSLKVHILWKIKWRENGHYCCYYYNQFIEVLKNEAKEKGERERGKEHKI